MNNKFLYGVEFLGLAWMPIMMFGLGAMVTQTMVGMTIAVATKKQGGDEC